MDFLASKNGYVGLAFFYQNSKNYNAFEIYGFSKKFCFLREVVDGKYIFKQKFEEGCGFSPNIWYTLVIKLRVKQIEIYLSEIDSGEQKNFVFS